MNSLRHLIYQNYCVSETTSNDLSSFMGFTYNLSLAYLKIKFKNHSLIENNKTTFEEIATDVSATLFVRNSNKKPKLLHLIEKSKSEIQNESDFNYWLMKTVIEVTDDSISHNKIK